MKKLKDMEEDIDDAILDLTDEEKFNKEWRQEGEKKLVGTRDDGWNEWTKYNYRLSDEDCCKWKDGEMTVDELRKKYHKQ